jgi:hypothetical protein
MCSSTPAARGRSTWSTMRPSARNTAASAPRRRGGVVVTMTTVCPIRRRPRATAGGPLREHASRGSRAGRRRRCAAGWPMPGHGHPPLLSAPRARWPGGRGGPRGPPPAPPRRPNAWSGLVPAMGRGRVKFSTAEPERSVRERPEVDVVVRQWEEPVDRDRRSHRKHVRASRPWCPPRSRDAVVPHGAGSWGRDAFRTP